jgi:hypothetical protein
MNRLRYCISRIRFLVKKIVKKQSYIYDDKVQDLVRAITQDGFAVVPNFYTEQECSLLRDGIDNLVIERNKKDMLWEDPSAADKRCFGAEEDNQLIAGYFSNRFLNSVADNYFGAKMTCSNTLASKIIYREGNSGSGQGWHRDGNQMQFKALVYLSDADLKDGPFQIIRASHKVKKIFQHIKIMDYDGLNSRFTSHQIGKVLSYEPHNHEVLEGKAGTLVLFDSSAIHSGSPLTFGGGRYALTNYYMPSYEDITGQRAVFLNAHKKENYASKVG